MAKGETTWKTYPCKLKYAKVFNENMDTGLDDDGKPIEADWAETIRNRGGKWSTDMCITEATKDKMISDGIPEVTLGYAQFKADDEFEGHPWRYNVKRYVITGMKDRKTGEPVLNDPPSLGNLKELYEGDDGRTHASHWKYEDGLIGNGSDANVTLSIYKNGNKRIIALQKIGLVEVVPYEDNELVFY
jgi:hypothetical protein